MGIFLLRSHHLIVGCLLACFSPIPIYPLAFAATAFVLLLQSTNIAFPTKKTFAWMILLVVFLLNMFFVHFIRSKPFISAETTKPIINLIFLAAIWIWVDSNVIKPPVISALAKGLALTIALSALQVLLNVARTNLWLAPLIGVKNSVDAYKIVEPGVYWGIPEKNIWATKIIFTQILLLFMLSRKMIKINPYMRVLIYISSAISTLYTFSRTAQGVFIIFIFWEFFLRKISLKLIVRKPLGLVASGMALGGFSVFAYNKLFHFTLKPGDGMESRVRMWTYLWYETNWRDTLLGKGILYAKEFLPKYRMVESNFHNAFLNTLMDFGLVGLISLIAIFTLSFRKGTYSLFVYLIACMSFQYLGYDNDIVIYLCIALILGKYLLSKSASHESRDHKSMVFAVPSTMESA